MNIEDKIKQLHKNLVRARKSGNFRRIHKWENKLEHANKRMCPWNGLNKKESLFRVKRRIDGIRFRSDHRFEDYKWDWCGVLKCAFVRCPHCGNNCCNAVYGRLLDGEPTYDWDNPDTIICPTCPIAYDIQEFAYRLGKEPPRSSFPNADAVEERHDDLWNESFDWLDDNKSDATEHNQTASTSPVGS